MIRATLFCANCGTQLTQYDGARFTICPKCGFQTNFSIPQKINKIDSVTLRTDDSEEIQAMHALIQRWATNGWKVKTISQFSRSESSLGGLGMQISSYSTIVFEKDN